jgi:phage-related protein
MARRWLVSGEKPLFWVGSARRDLLAFPAAVKDEMGMALSVAQFGGKHPAAKPWHGQGPGVLEVVDDFRGDAYRAVYTVRFAGAVYVLHAFQKKSTMGVKTPKGEVELVRDRLRAAREDYEARLAKQKN